MAAAQTAGRTTALAAVVLVTACGGPVTPTAGPSPTASPVRATPSSDASPDPSPTRPALASPPPSPTASLGLTPTASPTAAAPATSSASGGLPSATCINGWHSPAEDSALYREAVDIVQQHVLYDVPVQVEDIRYFTGPDVPWIIEPHHAVVERWYVKTGGGSGMESGRWLIEKRTGTIKGVAAVAPYDSTATARPIGSASSATAA